MVSAAPCLFTWHDIVRHQCERTGEHTYHRCPCGAQRADEPTSPSAAEALAWADANLSPEQRDAIRRSAAEAPPLPEAARTILRAHAVERQRQVDWHGDR